jgi:hypothetical protein
MTPCPTCGGEASKHGTKPRRVLDMEDGRPTLRDVRVQRWRCGACGGFFSTGEASRPRGFASVPARDAVAEACFAAGWAPAAARFGIDEKTARGLWNEWAAAREAQVPERVPETVGVHVAAFSGTDRAVVSDVSAAAVVDLLHGASADDLKAWMGGHDMAAVDTVVMSMHPPFRDAVREAVPWARAVVCRGHAAAVGAGAFLHALRARKRLLGHGRNVSEAPRLFVKRAADLSETEREAASGWDDGILALRDAKDAFLDALASPGAACAAAFGEVRRACRALGAAAPVRLLDSWGEEIAAGAGDWRLDAFQADLDALVARLSRRRPVLPFDLARGAVVLRDWPRAAATDMDGVERDVGVEMASVAV